MSRILSLLLFLTMLLPSILILTACDGGEDPPTTPPTGQPPEDKAPALYLPTAGSFSGHSTENFDTFVYSPPSVEALTNALAIATDKLLDKETDYATALSAVDSAEALYAAYAEMLAYAQICYQKDRTSTYFAGEYKRLYEASPTVCFAMEKLFCAVSASKHGAALAKTDYFPSDIVERYREGGIYTAQTLPLFEEETRLLLASEAISADTVTITFDKFTGSLTSVLSEIGKVYTKNSAEYQQAEMRCQTLYAKAAGQKRADIFLSLVKVRREIADVLELESYAELAHQRLGYEANEAQIAEALTAVESYVLPVYRALSSSGYFIADTGKVEKIRYPEAMLNTLTAFYEARGGKLFEGYNYLLNRGLFSLEAASSSRATGCSSVFLSERLQPFLFISAEGSAADYLTTADAIGAALYYYCNGEKDTAFSTQMRTAELSNALNLTLRLLTLEGMEEALSKTESAMEISSYQVLLKSEIYNILRTTLTQSMRAEIELQAYALDADDITREALNGIVARAAERFGCYEMQDGELTSLTLSTEGLLSRDTFHTPTKSFSDLTSAYIALSLFLKENKTDGAGFASLEVLLSKDMRDGGFSEILEALSLPHPAEAGSVRELCAALYEALTGYSYDAVPTVPPSLT